MIYTTTKK